MLGHLPDPALTAGSSAREARSARAGGPASSSHTLAEWQRAHSSEWQSASLGSNRSNTSPSRGYSSGSSTHGSSRQNSMQASMPGFRHERMGMGLPSAVEDRRIQQEASRKERWQSSGMLPAIDIFGICERVLAHRASREYIAARLCACSTAAETGGNLSACRSSFPPAPSQRGCVPSGARSGPRCQRGRDSAEYAAAGDFFALQRTC